MDSFTISYLVLWGVVLVEAVLLLLVLRTFGSFYLSTARGISRDGLQFGVRAPEFERPTLDGPVVRLRQYRGQWVLLYFADPLCEDCYRILPSLAELQEQMAGAATILFLFRGDLADAAAFPDLAHARVPVVAVGRKGLIEQYRVRVSPFLQVLDPDGIVRAKGLANDTYAVAHVLAEAGFEHPVTADHRRESHHGVPDHA